VSLESGHQERVMTTQNAPAGTFPGTDNRAPGAVLLFVPPLVVLAAGSVKPWREQSGARREDR
jgi:hypothetical protein